MTYGMFNIYYKDTGLSTLISVDVIDEFLEIKKDLLKISYASFLLELTNQVLKENKHSNIFDLLISSLIKINEGFDPLVISNILELKFLEYLGVMPCIDSCVSCGSLTNIVTIDGDLGGYVCKSCYKNQYLVDPKTIKLIRMFYYVNIARIKELNINKKNINEINKFIDIYYSRYTGLYLHSKALLNKITS